MRNEIMCGDALDRLQELASNSVDLIVTSPPYSNQRAYSGVSVEKYVEWFKPIAQELFRVLKPQKICLPKVL